jgi:hypothetical protein
MKKILTALVVSGCIEAGIAQSAPYRSPVHKPAAVSRPVHQPVAVSRPVHQPVAVSRPVHQPVAVNSPAISITNQASFAKALNNLTATIRVNNPAKFGQALSGFLRQIL